MRGSLRLATAVAGFRHRRATLVRRAATIELCAALAAELRAGAVPVDALIHAIGSVPGLCDAVARTARLGGEVGPALVAASVRPGAAGLARLAAVWSVTQYSGAGLVDGVERIAEWLRDDEAMVREVGAQLAGARATARLLAVLPVVGLALGSGIGAEPLGVLLHTPWGLACLALGSALVGLGLWWTERLARSVEDRI
jgi:tight adherence protein B